MVINYVEAVTYICLALSPIAAIANITSFFYTKKTFNDNAPYRILQIECAITTVCQFGYIGILLGSLQESPSIAMCISASSVSMFDFSVLYITRTALSRVRYEFLKGYTSLFLVLQKINLARFSSAMLNYYYYHIHHLWYILSQCQF